MFRDTLGPRMRAYVDREIADGGLLRFCYKQSGLPYLESARKGDDSPLAIYELLIAADAVAPELEGLGTSPPVISKAYHELPYSRTFSNRFQLDLLWLLTLGRLLPMNPRLIRTGLLALFRVVALQVVTLPVLSAHLVHLVICQPDLPDLLDPGLQVPVLPVLRVCLVVVIQAILSLMRMGRLTMPQLIDLYSTQLLLSRMCFSRSVNRLMLLAWHDLIFVLRILSMAVISMHTMPV
ncbi:hypothetical protein GGX14DRAFT_574046 [Mycena pura]|uniref:Uncharacterized protein n=1 Tax=Mycena pura TaxID=153505 RepID=A0AAD6Y3M3_9AGAR|nr:hypothetical protein GGX14DRAFT_574046 [Mycena pura]